MSPLDNPQGSNKSFVAESRTSPARSETVDALFDCLASSRRRNVLEYVSENAGPVGVEDIVQHLSTRENATAGDEASADAAEEIAISLVHNHLPRLRDAGVLAVDREANTVGAGDRFEAAKSVLEAV